jgi:CDP-ribitol ribitolphosphotransferase / teichoic acid ribitol-phosphate polymerase
MKKFLIYCFNYHLKFTYLFIKFFKIKNRVVFISRQTDKPSLDFNMLIEEIKKHSDIEVIVLCRRMKNTLKDNIYYYFHLYKQMYYLATSRVCIVDTYIPTVSILNHKKTLKIMQIWHALGAVKKFGFQSVGSISGRDLETSIAARMHANYDAIISTSEKTTEYYMEAFGYKKEAFYNYGLPRIDHLYHKRDNIRENILKKYPTLNEKPIILYAPTFRTTKEDNANKLIEAIDLNKYHLIIKEHYSQKLNFNKEKIFTCSEFSPLELLSISDYLITDYSAVSIEAAILDVKTYFYLFDYEDYKTNNGLNIELINLYPNLSFKSELELYKYLDSNNYDYDALKRFKSDYLPTEIGSSTIKIVDLILKWYYNQ